MLAQALLGQNTAARHGGRPRRLSPDRVGRGNGRHQGGRVAGRNGTRERGRLSHEQPAQPTRGGARRHRLGRATLLSRRPRAGPRPRASRPCAGTGARAVDRHAPGSPAHSARAGVLRCRGRGRRGGTRAGQGERSTQHLKRTLCSVATQGPTSTPTRTRRRWPRASRSRLPWVSRKQRRRRSSADLWSLRLNASAGSHDRFGSNSAVEGGRAI